MGNRDCEVKQKMRVRRVEISSWREAFQYQRQTQGWVYRGQRDATWDLHTALDRHCDRLGVKHGCRREFESELLREFRRVYHNYSGSVPETRSVLEWASLMQHHGGPTRLLDFTYSIWIAAYFAMEHAEGECAVWAVDPRWASSESIKKLEAAGKPNAYMISSETRFDENSERKIETLLFKGQQIKLVCSLNPFRLNDRLRTQSGVFLVPGDVGASFMQNLEALPGGCKVLKIVIPHELHFEGIKLLSRMNISRTSLFPGLDGYTQSLGVYHPGTDASWLDDRINPTISAFIEGVPYCRFKTRGNTEGRRAWTENIKKTTMNLPKVKGPCSADVEFYLPRDKYPNDYPDGPDLDNLLKLLLDALSTTVLSEVRGKDGCIVRLNAAKKKVSRSGTDRFGARIKLVELPSQDY